MARLCHDPECLAFLLEHLAYPDLKASLTVARVLGAVGRPAVGPLAGFFRSQADPYARAMALHAISKVHDPGVLDERDIVLVNPKYLIDGLGAWPAEIRWQAGTPVVIRVAPDLAGETRYWIACVVRKEFALAV